MVFLSIFEVAVLHQFGVQSAVGCIADVLEENAYKLVADSLCPAHVYGQSSLDGRCRHISVLGIVMHTFARLASVLGQQLEVLLYFCPFRRGNLEAVAFMQPSADGSRVPRPGFVVYLAGLIGREMAEVRRGRSPALTLGRLKVDVKRSVGIGKQYWVQAFRGTHDRIVLRPPVNEVVAVGGSKLRRVVVHLKYQAPRAIVGTGNAGVKHLLLCSPRAIVGRAQTASLAPLVTLPHSNVKPSALVGRIDEYGSALVGLCRNGRSLKCRDGQGQ